MRTVPKRAVRASRADRRAATAAGRTVAVVEQQRSAWPAAKADGLGTQRQSRARAPAGWWDVAGAVVRWKASSMPGQW